MFLNTFKVKIGFKTLLVCGAFGILLQALSLYLGYRLIPDIVNGKIWENKILETNTDQWKTFMKTPFPFTFKIYFFQVKNPEEVVQGAKPVVEEVGPYVYKYQTWKSEIELMNSTDEIAYYEYMRFDFDKSASGKLSDEDYVTILNMAYNTFILTAEATQPELLSLLNGVLPAIFAENEGLFAKVKVKDFLFDGITLCENGGVEKGFPAKLACKQVKQKALASKNMKVLDSGSILFSMLDYKNMTHQGRFVVKSGKTKKEQTGHLTRYENMTYLSAWKGGKSSCNRIRGITTVFPADVDIGMVFESFAEDICRTMAMDFKKKQYVADVQGYKFGAVNNSLDSPVKNQANECFCVNRTMDINGEFGCLGDGLLDLTSCVGAPLIMSFPHLLGADPKYMIEGLKPDLEKHETFAILEPTSGIPMKYAKRVQFNQFIKAVEDITRTENVTNHLVPVLWLEESLTLDDKFMDIIKTKILKTLKIVKIVTWVFVALGVLLMILAIVLFILSK